MWPQVEIEFAHSDLRREPLVLQVEHRLLDQGFGVDINRAYWSSCESV